MDPIERLSALFEKFPGIGPRQAQRFVQYLLRSSPSLRREMTDALQQLGGSVQQCPSCMRYFGSSRASKNEPCGICTNVQRDSSVLSIVAGDADLAALERSGTYRGHYFVLGGTISLASENMTGLRTRELSTALATRSAAGLKEVILAFPANPEGDATAIRLREELGAEFPELSITALGRGLSTGSELEYADPETIKSALDSRR
jgi:recombination protein RecR